MIIDLRQQISGNGTVAQYAYGFSYHMVLDSRLCWRALWIQFYPSFRPQYLFLQIGSLFSPEFLHEIRVPLTLKWNGAPLIKRFCFAQNGVDVREGGRESHCQGTNRIPAFCTSPFSHTLSSYLGTELIWQAIFHTPPFSTNTKAQLILILQVKK